MLKEMEIRIQKSYDIKERTYFFSLSIVKFIYSLERRKFFYSMLDQLLRSATSVGANIIEGKAASSNRDFIKFYTIALKSANETKYWLMLFRDGFEVNKERVEELLQEAEEIIKIIASIVIKLKQKEDIKL